MANDVNIIFKRPTALTERITHYCPGCTHGVIHRLVAESLDELGLRERAVGVAPVGCSVLAYNYFNCDFMEAAHGRAPALATGFKRTRPDMIVFTYQGDGDLASIGMGEIVHAANRGEKFTTIFVNNAIYGMTGGQMVFTPMHIVQAKKVIRKAFQLQKENKCFSMVEVLSTCPTNWGITPEEAVKWVASDMEPYYPLGIFKQPDGEEG
jgi:2-oxoglutarate ferredoxin oxidoreductase subunit beta